MCIVKVWLKKILGLDLFFVVILMLYWNLNKFISLRLLDFTMFVTFLTSLFIKYYKSKNKKIYIFYQSRFYKPFIIFIALRSEFRI